LIVSDTDFLSAFAKIRRINLILDIFKEDHIIIPEAVYHELKQAPVFDMMISHISKKLVRVMKTKSLNADGILGKGERQAIYLSIKNRCKLLMDDRVAGCYAEKKGVKVVDIPSFLLQLGYNTPMLASVTINI
jgi:predicted nucleic acid-binding protein